LVLMDTTYYITNSAGNTYCNYALGGGSGVLASMGTYIDINWSVQDGKLVLTDTAGNPVYLNPGKTWIGWASGNNGGMVTVE